MLGVNLMGEPGVGVRRESTLDIPISREEFFIG
jgi:hypothetical protein